MITATILVDNRVRAPELVAQHGFALWLESPSRKILFDTGATAEVLVSNAEVLGVDLATATDIVLSHGHWDHGGGLSRVMDLAVSARVWIPRGALLPRWHRGDAGLRDIALSHEVREKLVRSRGRWTEVVAPVELGDGIWITGPVPGERPAWTHAGLVRNEILGVPDDVPEEQAIAVETSTGIVGLVGCAHFGLDNLERMLAGKFPGRPLRGLVGGLHLESAPEGQLEGFLARLARAPDAILVPCHCSGPKAEGMVAATGTPGWEAGCVGKRIEVAV